MTSEQRQIIRHAIDAHRRATLPPPTTTCTCGAHRDNQTRGCHNCARRHRRRRQRTLEQRLATAIGPTVGFTPASQTRLVLHHLRKARK